MNLTFVYQNLIVLSLLKIVTVNFTMYVLTILTYFLKLYGIEKYIFHKPGLLRHTQKQWFVQTNRPLH